MCMDAIFHRGGGTAIGVIVCFNLSLFCPSVVSALLLLYGTLFVYLCLFVCRLFVIVCMLLLLLLQLYIICKAKCVVLYNVQLARSRQGSGLGSCHADVLQYASESMKAKI